MIDKLLKKARQSLKTARVNLEAGDTDAFVNRSYYAAFYAAWAMFERIFHNSVSKDGL